MSANHVKMNALTLQLQVSMWPGILASIAARIVPLESSFKGTKAVAFDDGEKNTEQIPAMFFKCETF